jgi:hypothetical protein
VDEGTEVEGGSGQEGKKNEHFNTIWTMFPTKQEWRVKEKASTLALTSSSDDMDVLDGDESPLIKDVSTADRHGHQYGVHAAGRVQGCRVGGRSDVSRPQGGHVQEAQGIEPAHEAIICLRPYRQKVDL